jgi:PHP domain
VLRCCWPSCCPCCCWPAWLASLLRFVVSLIWIVGHGNTPFSNERHTSPPEHPLAFSCAGDIKGLFGVAHQGLTTASALEKPEMAASSRPASVKSVRNSDIAELLARSAETAKQPLQRALRRAARRAFLWPQEAEEMHRRKQSLTELSRIGPYLEKLIASWLDDNPGLEGKVPDIRRNFLTLVEAGRMRSKEPARFRAIRGDLQMHTPWSDGADSIQDMADAAVERGYSYIAITDHSKGLKIAGASMKISWHGKGTNSRR